MFTIFCYASIKVPICAGRMLNILDSQKDVWGDFEASLRPAIYEACTTSRLSHLVIYGQNKKGKTNLTRL